jgi:hypothetical protein
VFTARYALSPYIKQIRFVFKGLINMRKLTPPSKQCNMRKRLHGEGFFLTNFIVPPFIWKHPAFYTTQSSITLSQEPATLPYPGSNQSTASHPVSLRPILTVSSHLRLYLLSSLFPPGFPTKTLYAPPLSHTCYILHPSYSLLYFITRKIFAEE